MLIGNYKGIIYSVEYKEGPLLGAYYDIRLIIGEKVSRARELNLIRAIDSLAQLLKEWTTDEETAIVTPEKAQELIEKWDRLNQQVVHEAWLDNDESQALVIEMLPILMQLREAGYAVTDDGEWYHPSEAN
jgi:hypothetical protein